MSSESKIKGSCWIVVSGLTYLQNTLLFPGLGKVYPFLQTIIETLVMDGS